MGGFRTVLGMYLQKVFDYWLLVLALLALLFQFWTKKQNLDT